MPGSVGRKEPDVRVLRAPFSKLRPARWSASSVRVGRESPRESRGPDRLRPAMAVVDRPQRPHRCLPSGDHRSPAVRAGQCRRAPRGAGSRVHRNAGPGAAKTRTVPRAERRATADPGCGRRERARRSRSTRVTGEAAPGRASLPISQREKRRCATSWVARRLRSDCRHATRMITRRSRPPAGHQWECRAAMNQPRASRPRSRCPAPGR